MAPSPGTGEGLPNPAAMDCPLSPNMPHWIYPTKVRFCAPNRSKLARLSEETTYERLELYEVTAKGEAEPTSLSPP